MMEEQKRSASGSMSDKFILVVVLLLLGAVLAVSVLTYIQTQKSKAAEVGSTTETTTTTTSTAPSPYGQLRRWAGKAGVSFAFNDPGASAALPGSNFIVRTEGEPGEPSEPCAGSDCPSYTSPVYSAQGALVGRVTVYIDVFDNSQFATTGKVHVVSHSVYELPGGTITVSNDNCYGAATDKQPRPGNALVIAAGCDGQVVGGTGRYNNARGAVHCKCLIEIDSSGNLKYLNCNCQFDLQ